MTYESHERELLFLLGLVMVGCPADDEPGNDDGAGTSNGTTPTTETADATTGMSTSTQGTTTTPQTTGEETSADTSADTSAEGSGTTGAIECTDVPVPKVGEISQECIEQVALIEGCYGPLAEGCEELYTAYCQYGLDILEEMYGMECRDAYAAALACINALDCKELGDKTACMKELEMADLQCQ
jgi:hypothetical protein